MRRTKIVATIGPACHSSDVIARLLDAGMDVARLNLSHGTHDEHAELCAQVRRASDRAGRAVGVLLDLQGPKIRLGTFAGGTATLATGATFTLTSKPVVGSSRRASTTYADLPRDVNPGDTVLIDDGLVRLRVESVRGADVHTRVLEGGEVSDRKGINLPGVRVSAPPLTEKDRDDLAFALSLPADLLALSFVRHAEDAQAVRQAMAASGVVVPVIAKLEKPEAVDNLEAIVNAFDGLMVARGDLGVELPLERVPLVQKRAVRLAREQAKPVIVATQMLESMIHHSRPTRAEASDVANAVLDGADALMLSAETSMGEHPVLAVETMSRIIVTAESEGALAIPEIAHRAHTPQEAIAAAAALVAQNLGASELVAFTQSGATARCLSSHRSAIPLLAFTTVPAVRSQLALAWGVETFIAPAVADTDAMVAQVDRLLLELGRARRGDWVVIVAGTPPGTPGSTNMLRTHRLGGS